MAFRQRVQHYLWEELNLPLMHLRCYSSKPDWNKLRPMILERVENRAKDYPVKSMVPVAHDVLEARKRVIQGVSILLKTIPVKACKYCPEVHIGGEGHHIKTCPGFKRIKKDREHKWVNGSLTDILTPVEAFHLKSMFQPPIKHEHRFDFARIPAVLELCFQAGAKISDKEQTPNNDNQTSNNFKDPNLQLDSDDSLDGKLEQVGQLTMDAWERLRLGVQKLLLVYPARVCEHCREVHVGPTGHKARFCGVFKFEGWRGAHRWKKAEVDDLVPTRVVWHRRPHDPVVLVDGGRDFYGHAPAVVELCSQAGARVPKEYYCMMKRLGMAPNLGLIKG